MDFTQLKAKGNDCYRRKDHEGALKFYDRALRLPKGELESAQHEAVIHLNKAAVLLELQRFSDAELEAQKAKELGGGEINEEKIYYRFANVFSFGFIFI